MSEADSAGGTRRFQAGERLFVEGESAELIYVIQTGTVRVSKLVFRESIVVEEIGAGSVCGDAAFAGGARYPVTATAVDAVEALVIRPAEFGSAMLLDPELVQLVVQRMAARVAAAQFRAGVLAMRSIEGRILLQLHWELIQAGEGADGGFVSLPFDLPQVLATEPERVRAALRSLQEGGLVEFDPAGRFRVTDLASFERKLAYLELADRFA